MDLLAALRSLLSSFAAILHTRKPCSIRDVETDLQPHALWLILPLKNLSVIVEPCERGAIGLGKRDVNDSHAFGQMLIKGAQ
jgi:hypothetical protein